MRRRLGSVTLAVAAALAVAAPAQAAKDPLNALPGQADRREQAAARCGRLRPHRGRPRDATSRSTPPASRRARCARRASTPSRSRTTRPPRIRRTTPAATPPGTSGPATTRCPATARSSTTSSTTGSRQSRSSSRRASARRTSAATIWALKVTKDADTEPDNTKPAVLYNAQQHAREWLAGETCRRTLDFFVDNYGRTGAALDSNGDPIAGSRPRRSPSSWTRASCGSSASPTRTATSTRSPREPAVAQEHGRQRRRRRPRRARGRRRPEPQLRDQLGPRQRGLLGRPDQRDLPRHRSRLRARDPGDEGALEQGRLRVPEERPHRGRAAAVSAGLPAVHADARQRDLRGAGRQRRRLRDRRQGVGRGRPGRRRRPGIGQPARRGRVGQPLRPGPRRPSCTSPTATRSTTRTTRTASSASRRRARCRPTRTSRASSSRTTRGTSRPSSSATCCSRSTWPGRPPTRGTGLAPRQRVQDFYVDDFAVSYGDPQTVEVTAKRSLGDVRLRYRVNGGRCSRPRPRGSGRRAVQQRPRRLLPPAARRGEGHRPG